MANPHPTPVIAVIGDVVASRQLPPQRRAELQGQLDAAMQTINTRYRAAVLADFLVTIGDEFQGILDDPAVFPDIVQDLREDIPGIGFRLVASRGMLSTELRPAALGTDGPAWHAARARMESIRSATRDGVGFAGFGGDDALLQALGDLLTWHWNHLVETQRSAVAALRRSRGSKKIVAETLGISQQSLSNRAQSAGWREYDAGLTAWREVLGRHAPRGAS